MIGGAPGVKVDPREIWALATLLALGALLLSREAGAPSLEFDEGVYLSSADLLGRGFELGRDVFTSQPPLFLTTLDLVNRLADGSTTALRMLGVGITLAGAVAGWALVRGIAGALPALAAAALVVLAPGVVDAAAVVSADVPSVALGTGALLAARAAYSRPWIAAVSGALLAAALLVKLLAAPFALALAVAAILRPPPPRALAWFAVGVLGVGCGVAVVYLSVLGEIWSGAVEMHLEAREGRVSLPRGSIATQVALVTAAYVGMIAILVLGLTRVPRERLRGWAVERVDLLALLAGALALVALHRPLLHHHLVIVAWPLALLAASTVPSRISPRLLICVAAAALLVIPWAVRGRDTVEGASAAKLDAIAALVQEGTSPGDAVVSDLPLVPLMAERPAAAETVDPSAVAIATGALTTEEILAAADGAGAAVVGRSFAEVPGLEEGLRVRFRRVIELDGVRVYLEPGRRVSQRGGSPAPAS